MISLDTQVLLSQLLFGGIIVSCAAIGLFFFRFYRRTHDRLLAIFGLAFWVLALNWIALAVIDRDEVRTALYAVRFLAFLAIAIAILDKNRAPRKG